jgi:hypothetical protein
MKKHYSPLTHSITVYSPTRNVILFWETKFFFLRGNKTGECVLADYFRLIAKTYITLLACSHDHVIMIYKNVIYHDTG